MKKIFLLFFLVHVGLQVNAQQQKFSGWTMYLHTIKITKNFSSHLDIQLRSDDNLKNAETFIFRPGINYHFRNKSIVTLGYGLVEGWRTISGDRGALAEHRIWQQYVIPQKLNALTINHRFRLEERFIPRAANQNGEIVKTETVYNTKFRYFFRSVIPLKSEPVFNHGAFAAIQNEIFVNVTNAENVNNKFFDQNRLYGAVGWRFSKAFDLETGYLYQFVSGLNGSNVNNHVIQLAGYLRL
jgi:Protein of unknown function (DUF2490)